MKRRSFISCCRGSRAFSLIEVVLAMAMAAMLALSLYTTMNVTLRARRTANAAVDTTRAVSIAADILAKDLESVVPPTGILADSFYGTHTAGGGTGAAGGDNDSLLFYAVGADSPMTDSPMSEGIRRIELLVRSDVTPPVLIRRVTRNLLETVNPPIEEEIICRNVRGFSIRYHDGTTWQEDWDSTLLDGALPMSVAITLDLFDPAPAVAADSPMAPSPRRVTRIIPIACGTPLDMLTSSEVTP